MTQKDQYTYNAFVAQLTKLLKLVEKRDMPSLTWVFGPSDYLIQKASSAVIDTWQKIGDQEIVTLEASEQNSDSFNEMLNQNPLFQPRTLFLVKRAERKPQIHKILQGLETNSNSNTKLMFLYQRENIDKRLDEQLTKHQAFLLPCFEPIGQQLEKLITGLIRRNGLQFSHNCQKFFLQSIGYDLFKVDNELAKLGLVFHQVDRPLESADIADHLGVLREDHAFRMTKHLLDGKLAQAEVLLGDLLRRGESALALLALLSRHCRNALSVKSSQIPAAQLSKQLRLPMPVISHYRKYVSSKSTIILKGALGLCLEADLLIKTSKIDEFLILQRILEKLQCPMQQQPL